MQTVPWIRPKYVVTSMHTTFPLRTAITISSRRRTAHPIARLSSLVDDLLSMFVHPNAAHPLAEYNRLLLLTRRDHASA